MKVIAEVGSNIKSYADCEYSICKAREAGANYVKFQCLSEKDLYGDGSDQYTPFHPDWIAPLKELADKTEIEFMCTGFSPEMYLRINPFVSRHKIASAEITDTGILSTVALFKKPVILSCGGSNYGQMKKALEILDGCDITLMYCVPKYPAKFIDFDCLPVLRSTFGCNISYGYSDHSIDINIIPKMAQNYGFSLIEKHVNFLDYSDTPDSNHSLDFIEFTLMVRILKGESISDIDVDGYNNGDMREKWQRRLINGKYLRTR